jgi:hypothetical protein
MAMSKRQPLRDEAPKERAPMPAKYVRAREEAIRFLARVDELRLRYEIEPSPEYLAVSGSREAGAVKRASLDLTRALAEMRKP